METLAGLAVLALLSWIVWQWWKAKSHEPKATVTGRGRPAGEQVRSAAESAGHDYVLEPFDGDHGNGYTLRRVADWQRLQWRSADGEPGLLPFNVVGESYREDEVQDEGFAPGSRLALVPEPDNPHDPNAVAVWNEDRTAQAGYVPAELAEEVGYIVDVDRDHICLSMWEARSKGQRTNVRCLLLYDDVSVGTIEYSEGGQ